MENAFTRTQLLLGEQALSQLQKARVLVFGVGGVGGYVVEALARSGVGAIDVVDNDTVSVSNINRQIIATHSTVGQYKVDVVKNRVADINPNCQVTARKLFYLPETSDRFDFTQYDYVVDAIDTVSAKLDIVQKCYEKNVPIISSMGAGNKLDPTAFRVADIYKTSVCPLARVMRTQLKKRGVKKLKVVFSTEQPLQPSAEEKAQLPPSQSPTRRDTPGSIAFVPSVVGLIIASEVIKDIISK